MSLGSVPLPRRLATQPLRNVKVRCWLDVDAGKTTSKTAVLVKYDDGESMSHDLGSGRQSHWEWVLEERPPGEEGGAWLKGEYQR